MKKLSRILFFVLTGALVSGAGRGLRARGGTPATATFRDATADMVVDDGNGSYQDGVNCVNSYVQGSLYFLRTVNQQCTATTSRAIVLNFSNIVTPPSSCNPISDPDDTSALNPCGTNSIPDVRLSALTLFRKSASTTPVSLFLNLHANFRETDFELDFLNPVPFTGTGTMRVLTGGPDAANSQLAELYRINEAGQKVSVGIYNMPFQVTVTEQ